MTCPKQLFLIGFLIAAVTGCATRPAPTIDRMPESSAAARKPAPRIGNDMGSAGRENAMRSPELLLQAIAAVGHDYQRGGKSMASGFDCSGLVAHVFKEAYGVLLPHNARAQSERGRFVPAKDLEAGDLVFFNTLKQPFSHVGIYLGDGRFIHAPKPGATVRTESMQLSYWRSRYDGARRIID